MAIINANAITKNPVILKIPLASLWAVVFDVVMFFSLEPDWVLQRMSRMDALTMNRHETSAFFAILSK
jgi:fumarate reductase subunit C